MRLPLSWLRHFLPQLPSAEAIARHLQDAGIEVDSFENIEPRFSGIIVGRVDKVEKHPKADRLVIATVFDGNASHQVVCGASNCREGLLVPFAPVGSRIGGSNDPNSFVIKQAQLRGVDSFGMLAAAEELGLEEKSSGLMELDASCIPGTNFDEYFTDTVLELSLTPDFGHALSVLGIARLLSARTGDQIQMPVPSFEALQQIASLKDEWSVEIENFDFCSRYSALVLSGVRGAHTPLWMRLLLERAGYRLISPLVDCSNFVMMAIGQPLHCFDQKAFPSKKIRVGLLGAQATAELLDGKVAELPIGTGVIFGSFGPEAVAGVMGMKSSSVSADTEQCIVESAYFSPQVVRRSKMRVGVSSESSRRFERGCDPESTVLALAYFLHLVQQMNVKVSIDALIDQQGKIPVYKEIGCRLSRVKAILGYPVSEQELDFVFTRHGFPCKWISLDECVVTIPPRRHDLNQEIDLIEEIWKLLPPRSHEQASMIRPDMHPDHPLYVMETKVRKACIQAGLQEWINCSLISPQKAKTIVDSGIIGSEMLVSVSNPMSVEQSVLRPMLLPGILESYARNQNVRELTCHAFEVGNIHMRTGTSLTERSSVGILLSGSSEQHHFDEEIREVDFLDLKGVIDEVCSLVRISPTYEPSELSLLHPGRQAAIYIHGARTGILGEIHPLVLKKYDIKHRVYYAELDIQDLMQYAMKQSIYQPVHEFPGIERDWTITVSEKLSYARFEQLIRQEEPENLESFRLQSIFRSERIGSGMKNMTVRFYFRSLERTLEQQEVEDSFNSLIQSVSAHLSQEHML